MLTTLSEWCQNVMTFGHLMTEDLPYKPLYFQPGSLRLAPGSKYSDLIGTMSVFNCLYFGHYFSNGLKFVNNSCFKQLFQNLRPKVQHSKNIVFVTSHFGTLWGGDP